MKATYTLCIEWFYPGFPNLSSVETGIGPLRAALKQTNDLGFGAAELVAPLLGSDPLSIPAAARQEMRQAFVEAGVKFAGFHWALLGANTAARRVHLTDPTAKSENVAWLIGLAQLCHDLGGGVIVVGSPKQRNIAAVPGLDYETGFAAAVDTFQTVAAQMPADVTYAVEQLDRGETDFLTEFAEAQRLVDRVASPRVQLVFDLKALLRNGLSEPEAAAVIIRHKGSIVHVHVNDKDKGGPRPDGSDLQPVLRALSDTGYTGCISVEVFNGDTVPLAQSARVALELMHGICGKLWL